MAFPESVVLKVWEIVKGKCEGCGKKLAWSDRDSAGAGTWQAHHDDGNPNNNAITNCKILCGPCHVRAS